MKKIIVTNKIKHALSPERKEEFAFEYMDYRIAYGKGFDKYMEMIEDNVKHIAHASGSFTVTLIDDDGDIIKRASFKSINNVGK